MLSIPAYGANDDENFAGNQLRILGILVGYEDGTLRLDNPILRSEIAALMVRTLGYENSIVIGENKNFQDVKKDYWAYQVIQNAYKLGIIKGYPEGTFKPKNNISFAETLAIMVNALEKNDNLEGQWPHNYIERAKQIGIIPKDSSTHPDKIVTRGEVAKILWQTIITKR